MLPYIIMDLPIFPSNKAPDKETLSWKYLFILALKVFLIQIRENADVKGIIIDESEIKLSTYADYGSFFVTDVQSLQLIFFLCNQLREFSSLKLNLEQEPLKRGFLSEGRKHLTSK